MSLQIGGNVPQFSLPATTGESLSTEQIKGENATVVMFWCNHCPYVIPNQQRVIDMQQEYGSKGVRFAAICSNNSASHPADSFENMQLRATEMGYNFPYLHDEDQSVARSFGAERTPHVFLFDAQGKLAYSGRIDDSPQDPSRVNSPDLRNAIEAVLAGTHPDPDLTGPIGCSIKWK
ncbi:thioredoxin family protein [bacterium]|nr:thioredoxin family protein [bacterium]